MSVDHYAGAAHGWARCATIVYGPIARQLIDTSPHDLDGHLVLDVGAGTGVASAVLTELGARPIGVDLSLDMLSWQSHVRPPGVVADVCSVPIRGHSVDDVVAAFVLNHLIDPASGLSELRQVIRPGGALTACVYANASRSDARDAIDQAARSLGWEVPDWYVQIKRRATPLLGTAGDMERAAKGVGLVDVMVDERPVDVGVSEPEQLVDYRLGQAHFAPWLDQLGPDRAEAVRERLVTAIRPIMQPYRPIVVFLTALAPAV